MQTAVRGPQRVDFVYVPKTAGDRFTKHARAFLELVTPLPAFGKVGLGNLQDILKWVDTKVPQGQRAGKVTVVSHAWPHAMSIPFTPKQKSDSTYTRLVDLQPSRSAEFELPARFKQAPGPDDPRTHLIIKGCEIGRSEAYMRLLKTLLGGELEVTAAQYYEHFIKLRSVHLDFLTYGLVVNRRSPILSHQSLVKAFNDTTFPRYDNSRIPPDEISALLDQLLGPKYGGRKKLDPKQFLPTPQTAAGDPLEVNVQVKLQFPAQTALEFESFLGAKRIEKRDFLFVATRVEHDLLTMDDVSTAPSAAQIRTKVEGLKTKWEADYGNVTEAGVTVTKSFAEYLGLSSGDDVFTQIEWRAKTTKSGFVISGEYCRYEMEMPVTSIADGTLLFTGRKRHSGTQIKEVSTWPVAPLFARLFRTV